MKEYKPPTRYYENKNFFISVAYDCTFDRGRVIDETALVFEDKKGRHFWILKYDVHELYKNCKTLASAKKIYKEEAKKGNEAFWTTYPN